jgi:hypothetical protein
MSGSGPQEKDDPAVARLQQYLRELEGQKFDDRVIDELIKKARGRFRASKKSLDFLQEVVLGDYSQRFASEKARLRLRRFIMAERFKPSLWERVVKGLRNIFLLLGVFHGQVGMLFKDGTASPEARARAREKARPANVRGTVRLARLDPATSDRQKIYEVLKKTISAIHGFAFLDHPPPAQDRNAHTILIKPGVNWGYFLYPTITSWQSVYALTRLCFEEAEARGAAVHIIVGDESGIECALHEHTTTGNLAYTGIYHAAVLAGLERAAALEPSQPDTFPGARQLLPLALELADTKTHDPAASLPLPDAAEPDASYTKMIELAQKAGVQVIAFDEGGTEKELYAKVEIKDAVRYFNGIMIPLVVRDQVTDIINLSKPPGRHLIMGNTGLTGAIKNYVGLLKGSDRAPGLHDFTDRSPAFMTGDAAQNTQHFENLHQALKTNSKGIKGRWHFSNLLAHANPMDSQKLTTFHERLAEIYLAFKEKERFCVTDMRQTLRSIGPDVGDPIDIGAAIAATDAPSLDAVAGAILELAYEKEERDAKGRKMDFLRGFLHSFKPGGASPEGFIFGWTWLRPGTSPFDLKSHIAANSYKLGPVDCDHLDLLALDYTSEEMLALTSILRRGQPLTTTQ